MSKTFERKYKLLLIGCGDIAIRTQKYLQSSWNCLGVRRQSNKIPSEIEPLALDITDPQQAEKLNTINADAVLITLTPGEFTQQRYHQTYVVGTELLIKNLKHSPGLVIFVSSTSVYGENQGQWVEETSMPKPGNFSGTEILAAEEKIKQHFSNSCIVRFSGIYGPGREHLINQVKKGIGCPETPKIWSNRIHSDDCARLLSHLLHRYQQQLNIPGLVLATDQQPATQYEVRTWLANTLGIDQLNENLPLKIRSNKRIKASNYQKIGFQLKFPDYKSGYQSILENLKI